MNNPIRILCVDDEAGVLKAVKRVFENEPYEVLTAASGKEGLKVLEEAMPVHVVIADYRMPQMDGVEFLRRVYHSWPDTVRMVLSGFADTSTVIAAINEGQIYKFIIKPWNNDELRITVANAIERYVLVQERNRAEKALKDYLEDLEVIVAERTRELREAKERLEGEMKERLGAEQALISSEARYRSIFENAMEGIFQATKEGYYLNVNPALVNMLGYNSTGEMISTVNMLGEENFVNREDGPALRKMLRKHGAAKRFETEIYRKDKGRVWVLVSAYSVHDPQNHVLYYEGIMEEVTERKHAEIALKRSLESLRKAINGIIQAVTATVETRDPYTSGHQKKVADLAVAIAAEMSLPPDQIDAIRMAGAMHDIGKVAAPAEILSKPGRLNDTELALVKMHPRAGFDILKGIDFPWPIAEIILQHHERLDGSGYPEGLEGEDILLEARILAVADVIDAIASHRPYRAALGKRKAMDQITAGRGTLFDPQVVDACLKLFARRRFKVG